MTTPLEAAVAPSLWFSLPFVLMLTAIAVLPMGPVRVARWWHKNSSKLIVALVLAAVTIGCYALRPNGGVADVANALHHALLDEYIPFVTLIFSLYTVSGGVKINLSFPPTPLANCGVLLVGALLSNVVGTTGASVLLIRPLLRMNEKRRHVAHTFVFFIFLVGNVGGCLTPVGDPPLFLGYLRGVPFGWTAANLWREWLFVVGALLAIYYAWERWLGETLRPSPAIRDQPGVKLQPGRGEIDSTGNNGFAAIRAREVRFLANAFLLFVVVFLVATMRPGVPWLGTSIVPFLFLRELLMLTVTAASYALTGPALRRANGFVFGPALEVVCLFLGIFITMRMPIDYLAAAGGSLGLEAPRTYFWITGLLSGFLDNAPTYAIFFDLAKTTQAGGKALLPLTLGGTIRIDQLVAISLGAVFMGALTYIGNGPNFIVRGIVENAGRPMPSFFGYMAYSVCVLIPVLIVMSLIFV